MNKHLNRKYVYLLFFLTLFSRKNYCAIPMVQVAVKVLSGLMEQVGYAVMPFDFKTIHEQIAVFKEQSQRTHSVDFEFLKFMMVSKYGITLDSYNDYMLKYVTQVPTAETAKTSLVIAPVTLILPQAKQVADNQKIAVRPQQSFVTFENKKAFQATSFPTLKAQHEPSKVTFSVSLAPAQSRVPSSIARRDQEIKLNCLRIKNDEKAREEYKCQLRANINLLWNLLGLRGEVESLKAQCSIGYLCEPLGFNSGNILMDDVKPQLQNLLKPKEHFEPILSKDIQEKALFIVAPYFEAVFSEQPEGYAHFLRKCNEANIPGTDILIARAMGTNTWSDAISFWFSSISPHFCKLKTEEIENCAFVKDFRELEWQCLSQDFNAAQTILRRYQTNAETAAIGSHAKRAFSSELYSLRIVYDHYYSKIYNKYDIKYQHTDDPYYHVAELMLDVATLGQKEELKAIVKKTIEVRQIKLVALLEQVGADKEPSSFVRALGYSLIDAQSPQEIIQILTPLSKDHQDPVYVDAYKIFYRDGFPKLIACNEIVKAVPMPVEIANDRYKDARQIYNLCGVLQPKTVQEEKALMRAANSIAEAVKNSAIEKENLLLAEKIYQAIAFSDSDKSVLFVECENNTTHIPTVIPEQKAQQEEFNPPYGCGTSLVPESEKNQLCGSEFLTEVGSLIIAGSCFPLLEQKNEVGLFDCGNGQTNHDSIDLEDIPQCNWGKQAGYPSFGEREEKLENDDDASKVQELKEEDGHEENREKNLDAELEQIIKDLKNSVRDLTEEESLIIDQFVRNLNELIQRYGLNNIVKAMEIGNINGKKVLNKKNIVNVLVWIAKSLEKIDSDSNYEKFTHDPAHNGKIEIGNLEEAIAGIACVEQKILKNLKRSGHQAEEFIDEQMREWDVKTARSRSLFDDIYIFNIEKFMNAVKIGLRDGQNLIIQITDLEQADLGKLYKNFAKEFSKEELQKMVIIHADEPSKSKSTNELIHYLEEIICQ